MSLFSNLLEFAVGTIGDILASNHETKSEKFEDEIGEWKHHADVRFDAITAMVNQLMKEDMAEVSEETSQQLMIETVQNKLGSLKNYAKARTIHTNTGTRQFTDPILERELDERINVMEENFRKIW